MTSTTALPERLIDLEGCFNFRDLGGYPTEDGRQLRWRRLFRADGLYRLTPPDLERLAGFGLQTVIDLRTEQELTQRGRIEWAAPGLTYHHLPMIDVLPPRGELPSWVAPEFVAGQYTEMLRSGRHTIRQALVLLADADYHPAVFHCMAGKDRTGILSAIVLGLLGVSEEDIVADYALSSEAMVRMLSWLQEAHPESIRELEQSSAAIAAAEPASMSRFLEAFREEHGSFDAYADALGLAGLAARLRDVLLEG